MVLSRTSLGNAGRCCACPPSFCTAACCLGWPDVYNHRLRKTRIFCSWTSISLQKDGFLAQSMLGTCPRKIMCWHGFAYPHVGHPLAVTGFLEFHTRIWEITSVGCFLTPAEVCNTVWFQAHLVISLLIRPGATSMQARQRWQRQQLRGLFSPALLYLVPFCCGNLPQNPTPSETAPQKRS